MLSQCVQSFSSHCWGAFGCPFKACVWGGRTKAMCLVFPHTNGVSLYESRERQTIKRTNMCLVWVTDLAAPLSSTLGIITQSHWSQLLFHSGSVRRKKQNKTKETKSVWFLTSAHEAQAQPLTSLSTDGNFQHASRYEKWLLTCTVKTFLAVYCICTSLSTPVLNFPARFWKLFTRCVICWIGPALPGFRALLSLIR